MSNEKKLDKAIADIEKLTTLLTALSTTVNVLKSTSDNLQQLAAVHDENMRRENIRRDHELF